MKDWFIGIIDIGLIILSLLVMFLGFKKGFMNKALGIVGVIFIIIFAIMFAGQFADWLTSIKMPPSEAIYNHFFGKVQERFGLISDADGSIGVIQTALGVPYFIAGIIYFMLGKPEFTASSLATDIATKVTHLAMTIIAFFIIVIGVLLVIGILKLIAKAARQNVLIRVVDGILGIVLYLALFAAFVCVVLMVFRFIYEKNPDIQTTNAFMGWIYDDLHLGDDKFRITKAIYNNNVIYNFIHIFF